jgi:hypothetical protein
MVKMLIIYTFLGCSSRKHSTHHRYNFFLIINLPIYIIQETVKQTGDQSQKCFMDYNSRQTYIGVKLFIFN